MSTSWDICLRMHLLKSANQLRGWIANQRSRDFPYWHMQQVHRALPSWLFHMRAYKIFYQEAIGQYNPNHLHGSVQKATPADIPLLTQAGYPRSTLQSWMADGASAWFIADKGNLLASIWLNASQHYKLYIWLELKSPTRVVWFLWWWVAPEHRRRHLGMQVRMPAAMAYQENGHAQGVAVIDALNRNALKGVQKLGWILISRLLVIRCCGVTMVYFANRFYVGRWDAANPLALCIETKHFTK
ncbi:MAG: hypothetical protein R3A44_19125 [Caldilineaceae bacterium]